MLRDHLIAHLLGVITATAGDEVLFFGGTALALTHLPDGRLSEDIDLIALEDRGMTATALHRALPTAVLRSHGRLTWDRPLTDGRDTDPSVLRTVDGLAVRIQLLSSVGYPRWSSERRVLHRRFVDAPEVQMRVPTLEAFAAMKLVAWADRAVPRISTTCGCCARHRWTSQPCGRCTSGTDRPAARRRNGCSGLHRAPTPGAPSWRGRPA